jgi:Flp pilus assembly protein TadG
LCRKKRRGAAAVEFALIAPVFFLMIFGMIEFGRMVMVQQVITNGSREGARLAVLDGTSGAQVTSVVNDYLESARVSGANVAVNPTEPSSAGYGEPVSVTVTIPFSQVSWLPSPMFIGGDTVLTATTVMRRETVQ